MPLATPATTTIWTARDREILETLALRVPFLSHEQITRTWWPGGAPAVARRRLAALVSGGMLWRAQVTAHPELTLERPAATWAPGAPTPDLGAVSYHLQARWTGTPRPTTIFRATAALARRLGGQGGRLSHETHFNHDLHMGTLYLRLFRDQPTTAARWVSERDLAAERRHQKLPDAAIRAPTGEIERVIEFGGAYNVEHVRAFHEDCERRRLPYELW